MRRHFCFALGSPGGRRPENHAFRRSHGSLRRFRLPNGRRSLCLAPPWSLVLLAEKPQLTDHEALLTVLRVAVRRGDVQSTADLLLNRFGSLAQVLSDPIRELQEIDQLGLVGVAAIKTVHAAAIRLLRADAIDPRGIYDQGKLLAYLYADLGRKKIEQARALFIDGIGRVIAEETIGHGSPNHVTIYPGEVAKRALELRATALILVHNHPGGDPTPVVGRYCDDKKCMGSNRRIRADTPRPHRYRQWKVVLFSSEWIDAVKRIRAARQPNRKRPGAERSDPW